MTKNAKPQKNQMPVFVQNCNTPKVEIFAFCVIALEQIIFRPIKHKQNDLLNLSWWKNGQK